MHAMDVAIARKRCQVGAARVSTQNRQASVDLNRCIGCGVCVPTCPQQSNIPAKKAYRGDTTTNQRRPSRYDYDPQERDSWEIESHRKINSRFNQNRSDPFAEMKMCNEGCDSFLFLSA